MAIETKKTIVRALLIGINDYRDDLKLENKVRFDKLDGCMNDVKALRDWLAQEATLDVQFSVLQNQDATKAGIINAFRSFLAKCTEGEVALIYYSGHGATEFADTAVWTEETDGRLEGIACYYEEGNPETFMLADKEIRYLMRELWEKTHAHIVSIFDCCHSGDNTRALAAAASGSTAKERKIDYIFKKRAWENFLFADKLAPSHFANKSIEDALPSAPHIQFSAAESNEPSIEDVFNDQIRGAFTVVLMEVLSKSAGMLSYRDLHNRVRSRMRYKFEQRPKLYAPMGSVELKDTGFLTKNYDAFLRQANLTFNPVERKYFVNRGKMHGVQAGVSQVFVDMPTGDRHIGRVEKVRLDESVVVFDLEGKKAIGQIPQFAQMDKLQTRQISIRLVNKNTTVLGAVGADKVLIDNLFTAFETPENSGFVVWASENTEGVGKPDPIGKGTTDYDLILSGDTLHLTKPNDNFRPLSSPINARGGKAVAILMADFRQIAQWHYLTELSNEDDAAALPKEALLVEVLLENENGEFQGVNTTDTEGVVPVDLFKDGAGNWVREAKVRVTNQTKADLYVAGFIHGSDFSINGDDLFSDEVVLFESGASQFLFHGIKGFEDIVKFSREKHAYWYNWEAMTERIKFVFSPEEFDAAAFRMPKGLPAPIVPSVKTKSISGTPRSSISSGAAAEEEAEAALPTWNSTTISFLIKNPEYNQVQPDDVASILAHLEVAEEFEDLPLEQKFLAEIGLGLFFDKAAAFKGFSLKESLAKATSERGLIGDLFWGAALSFANNVARRLRYRTYKNALTAMPKQHRLVAEGDSWFQHPTLTDTIDYVGAVYPTRCISAAGDTLVDYLAQPEFLSIIREVKPKGFLLSGGGNDILGDQMKTFFTKPNDTISEGEKPERFIKDSFEKAIKEALTLHEEIYLLLQRQEPLLPIFVHGYDYIIPLNKDSKKRRWAGQVFEEVGIMRKGDQQAIIKWMIDTFNTRLKALAEKYQVHYIDMRGTVGNENEWSDEIHPTNEGYRKVSAKFIQKLNAVLGSVLA